MRGVVGGNNINHLIFKSLNQGLDVLFRSQRWIYLGVGIIADYLLFGQSQVMWRNLSGNPNAFLLGTANKPHRAGSADMSDVQPAPGQPG